MKLLITINDRLACLADHNRRPLLRRRSIEISLTEEQERCINLRKIGQINARDIYEEIESVALSLVDEVTASYSLYNPYSFEHCSGDF